MCRENFKIGDLIIAKENQGYTCTNEETLCVVEEEAINYIEKNSIGVKIIASPKREYLDNLFVVRQYRFQHITVDEYFDRFPNAIKSSDFYKYANENDKRMERMKEMNDFMNNNEKFVLSEEKREVLVTEITDLLNEYNYHPTRTGINNIIDEWQNEKGWVVKLFEQHPNYNGKYQIVFDSDFKREINKNIIHNFCQFLLRVSCEFKKEVQIGVFSYKETKDACNKMIRICDLMSKLESEFGFIEINGHDRSYYEREKERFTLHYQKYSYATYKKEIQFDGYKTYEYETYMMGENISSLAYALSKYTDSLADEEFANFVNSKFPDIKAVIGQKVSRIVNKICKSYGIDKNNNYNREFAAYSDAINPLTIKRHTILSCHPIDYLTMSFGNSWASCHTIDKHNKRGMDNDYSGCYSGGTMSYMLDGSSIVFYTVDKAYDGNEYELQPKINRNMFHIGEDKIIQARIYPQSTDGSTGFYREVRNIVQKIIADCLGVPNLWINKKGTDECCEVVYSKGVHYRDYENFSDCNVSYLKNEDDSVNYTEIVIGHDPICPRCGCEHSNEEAIECEDCYEEGEHECQCCGEVGDEDNMHYINGSWYCEDCCFYCAYHDEWEIYAEDSYYVEDYGRICENAYNYGDFGYCEHCNSYFCVDSDTVVTNDSCTYCCAKCAGNDGYIELDDGEWYSKDEVYYCEDCNRYVHESDWNCETDSCDDCAEELEQEDEELLEV